MDSVEKTGAVNDDGNSGTTDEQSQSCGWDSGARPSLSQVKKSWGFRRTTIAKREFMEEVGDLPNSPPLVRRGRSRRANEVPEPNVDESTKRKTTLTARSVIEDLQWSAPSSPVSEDSKGPGETSAGGSFDPSLWQDFGSAFHTAFSLLGGNEGLSLTDALTGPDFFGAANETEPTDPQPVRENEVPDNLDDAEVTQLVAPDSVRDGEGDYVLISSQEEDSDEMTLLQIKEQLNTSSRQADLKARGANGARGKARGRGRGRGRSRGKGKGRGRGKGRAAELHSISADIDDLDDDVMLFTAEEQQDLHKDSIQNDPQSPSEIESISTCFDISLNDALQAVSSDCIILDSDFTHSSALTKGQFDDAPDKMEVEEAKRQGENMGDISSITESEVHNSNASCFVCSQTHVKRFMICCNSCQEWFHNACVGISETQDWKIEDGEQDYMCLTCTTTRQTIIHLESDLEPDLSFPECLTLSSPEVGSEPQEEQEQQLVKEAALVDEKEEKREAVVTRLKTEAEGESKAEVEAEPPCEMETDDTFPLCTGPGCPKPALPDSVYCGTDCILQHAAITMKTLTGPKKTRPQRKAAAARPPAKAENLCRTSKRLAKKALEEAGEEDMEEDHTEREEPSAFPKSCDPSLTDVQSTSIPSSNLNTTSIDDTSDKPETDSEIICPPKQPVEEPTPDTSLLPQPVVEESPIQSLSQEKERKITDMSNQHNTAEGASTPTTEKSDQPTTQAPPICAIQHLEMGALIVKKTTYVIPKKQPVSQSPCSQPFQKVSSVPALLSETRNLLVPPAPSAPSSRPSRPNNQVRQSIQRSLTTILFKRVSDSEDLKMPESEVVKVVAGIEKEMFDIFRNTDSKYMNKYRTIMFNLKDPRNKGLLYRVVNGEIGPFRLVRMTQKDMQATKVPEPTNKETTQVNVEATKGTNTPKPEPVKINLPNLNPARPERKPETMVQNVAPAQSTKGRVIQPSKNKKMPDILSCMLKDTTSEHKAHLFDLKCKICTGQIQAAEDEEPARKKTRVSTSKDKAAEPFRKKSRGDESPLLAPLDTPEMDSSSSSLMDPSSHIDIDSPKLTIVESPASPVMDSPASPTLESPASPILESPASPTPEGSRVSAPKRSYTPVVIPTVSNVTITRRDPRTAGNRFTASLSGNSGLSNITTQAAPYTTLKGSLVSTSTPQSSIPPPKALPKSILLKPSSSADPRLYGSSSRTTFSQKSADGDTAQYLSKQIILWKGFLNMLTVSKFVTKGYLVSGPAENLKSDLPDTIQIGGRILPETVWDYVEKLKTSVTKELCVIRFQPATEEEEVAYVSLFSYFNSRGRFGVVANISRSIKDVYLVPLRANESVPSILQPFDGPGLEKNRPNLLLGLAIVQKLKRTGGLPQEIEEKKIKVNISKDPMWIPKPPVLYGSDKLDIFKSYDPETAASISLPESPDSCSSGSVTKPSLLNPIGATPSVSSIDATESKSANNSSKNVTPSSDNKTPLQTILKSLFRGKDSDSTTSDGISSKREEILMKKHVFSKVYGSIVDPIVQQYGKKSKVKKAEDEEKQDEFDRPYDPEEEYNPEKEYQNITPRIKDDNKMVDSALSGLVEDDVAYDPEDESIFEVFQSDAAVVQLPISTQSADTPPVSDSAPTASKSNTVTETAGLPMGAVVVSAATLGEQQRMLEELNKQIEEQKRQLKQQEEVLRQQREAVGMFMAHFSVSDTLMSPPTKSLPFSQLPSGQSGVILAESKPADASDKVSKNTVKEDDSVVKPETVKLEQTAVSDNSEETANTLTEQKETQENVKECENYSSAGEIEDSDVAYDPEDESLFDEIQDDVFKGGNTKTSDTPSRTGDSVGNKGNSPNSHHSRRRRSSPKRRNRERDHRSPSRRSQKRSHSHSRRHRDKDRHRRGERDRSRHRTRDPSEYPGRHRKDHATSRHSHGRRSSSSPRKQSASLSPKCHGGHSSQINDKTKYRSGQCNTSETVNITKASLLGAVIKSEPDKQKPKFNLVERSLEPIQNVKGEISEPSISEYNQISSSLQESKLSLQETWFQDKIESKIPLREIDPPLRDSPESPDPEPQFSKPFSLETVDCATTEDSSEQNRAKDENYAVTIGGQGSSSLPTGLNIHELQPGRDAVLHGVLPGTSFQGTVNPLPNMKDSEHGEIEKGIGFLGPDRGLEMQHATNVWGATPSIQNTPVDGSDRHALQQTACRQGSVLNLTRNLNPNITVSQTVSGDSAKGNQLQGIENSSLHRNKQDVIHPCPDVMQNIVQVASKSELSESSTQFEIPNQFIRNHYSNTPLSVGAPEQNEGYNKEALTFWRTEESRSQAKDSGSKSNIMRIEQSFGSAHTEGRISHPGTLNSHIRLGETGEIPSFTRFQGDHKHSKHTGSPTVVERGLERRDLKPFRGNVDLSDGQEHGDRSDMLNSDWRGPASIQISQNKGVSEIYFGSNATQSESRDPQRELNDRTAHQIGNKVSNFETHASYKANTQSFKSEITNNELSLKTQTFMQDVREQKGSDIIESRSNIKNPELQFTRNDIRQPVCSDILEKGPEKKGPSFEMTMHDRREPVGSDIMRQGPEWIGRKSENLVHDSRGPEGPHLMGQMFEKRNWPERRGTGVPDAVIAKRGHNMEDLGNKWIGTGGPQFRGEGPERRGLSMHSADNKGSLSTENLGSQSRGGGGPGPEGRCLAGPDRIFGNHNFSEQGPDNRSTMFSGTNVDRRKPCGHEFSRSENSPMNRQHSDWRGSQGPGNWGPGSERKGTYLGGASPETIEQEQTIILPDLEGPKPPSARCGPHLRANVKEGTYLNLEGLEHGRRGPNLKGPRSNIVGSVPNITGHGVPRTGRIMPQNECPEGPNISDTWPERVAPNIKRANSRGPPRDPQFKCSEQGRPSSNLEGLQPNRNMIQRKEVEHRRMVVEGSATTGMGPGFCLQPGDECSGPDYSGPGPHRQNPRGPSFREPMSSRPCSGMDSRKPDWRESSACRRQGSGEESVNTDGLGFETQNNWGESEPVQEFHDYEVSESDSRVRNFRPLRLLRRNFRRPGPNARGFAPNRRGNPFEWKWSDRGGQRFGDSEGDECSADIWDNSGDGGGLETLQDYPDNLDEELNSYSEWRDTKGSDIQFSVSGNDWDESGHRGPGPIQDNLEMDCPGPNRGEEHGWTEPDRKGSGPFFRGRGGPCNRRQSWGRVRGRVRGLLPQRHIGMEGDRRQQDFKGDMRCPVGGMSWAHRGGFNFKNSHPNNRAFEMEAPGGPDLSCPESDYFNFNDEGPELDGRVTDFGDSEMYSADVHEQGAHTEVFNKEFRRGRRGPIMRHGPSKEEKRAVFSSGSDFRHGRFPESDGRDLDGREREQRHQGQTTSRGRRVAHQEGYGPCEGPPAPFNRPVGPGPESRERKLFRDFDSSQNQQVVQPQTHRGALLPTPSDCPLSNSNTMTSHDDSSAKTPQFCPPFNNRGRGRAVDTRFRGRARAQRRSAPAY